MKAIIRQLFGNALENRNRGTAETLQSPNLENLEPRLLFSAAPVDPDLNGESEGQEQAVEESITVSSAAQETAGTPTETESTQEGSSVLPIGSGQTELSGNQGATLLDVSPGASTLNQETLEAIADAAAERWRASGLTAEQSAALDAATYEIADLTGPALAQSEGNRITVDIDAAGSGNWFVDATPNEDEEFISAQPTLQIAAPNSAAAGQFDLLTALLHEQGHLLGIGHGNTDASLMGDALNAGQRILPADGLADGAIPGSLTGISTVGAAWSQLGSDIDGEFAGDQSGRSISVSSDGKTVAIGAHFNDGNGSDSGHVRVFRYNAGSSAWIQLGSDIDGEGSDEWSGYSVSLSSDGTTLAIGSILNDDNGSGSGHVRVFRFDAGSSAWNQLGSNIGGEAPGDKSGRDVSLSADGSTLAIGATNNDGNGADSGHVRVFRFNAGSSTWNQLGADINGEAAGDYSGSVSLSADGNTLAIGANLNDGNGFWSGHVRVFRFNAGSSSWNQLGSDIDGEAARDRSGASISLSADGTTLAIGANQNSGNGFESGHVRVFRFNAGSSTWNQLGADINGEAARDRSGSVSLSADGSTLAIGASKNDGNGIGSGHVRVFRLNAGSSAWDQLGADINGEVAGDYSGRSVSLSSDGNTLAISAFENDGNGTDSGHVRVYQFTTPTTSVAVDGAGNLVVTDVLGGDTDDDLTIVVDGANYRITDATNSIDEIVSIASVTGTITINGSGGDDTLTIDFSGGNITQAITFNGGASGNDTLRVVGGGTERVEYSPDVATFGNGVIDIAGGSSITFTGLEPIEVENVASFDLNLPGGDDIIDIANGSTAGGDDALVLSGTSGGVSFEVATLRNIGEVTIDTTTTTDGNDAVTVTSANNNHLIDNLIIDAGIGSDQITVNGVIALDTNGSLELYSGRNVALNNSLIVTGTGTITVDGERQVSVNGANVSSDSGAITIDGGSGAGQDATGINITNNSNVTSTTGDITIRGTGGDTGTNLDGVIFHNGSNVTTGGFGSITIVGTAHGTGDSDGVDLQDSGTISTVNGALMIAGTGIDGGEGIQIGTGTVVEATGSGQITITGTAGVAAFRAIVIDASGTTRLGAAAGTGGIVLIGDTMDLSNTVTNGGALSIQPLTAGTTIGLGGGAGTLSLNDTSLSKLADGFSSITIGNATAGNIDIDTATFNDPLNLITGGEIHDGAGTDITMTTLTDTLTVDGTVAPGQSPGILSVSGNFAFGNNSGYELETGGATEGTGPGFHDQIDVTGTVTIGSNVTLNESAFGGYSPLATNEFTIINNDGADAVVGTFNGLAEGAILSNFLGSGIDFFITYQGGDGNDVVLTATPPVSATETSANIDGSGNLLIEDDLGANTDDNLSITRSGGFFTIEDLDGNSVGSSVAGSVQVSASRVDVPEGAVTGGVIINSLDGDDRITIGDLGILNGNLSVTGGDGNDEIIQNGDATLTGAGAVQYIAERIRLNVDADLITDTGNVTMTGTGGTGNGVGVHLKGATITSNSGVVSLEGVGGDTGVYNRGVLLDIDYGTGTASEISTGGGISMVGTGGTAGVHASGVTLIGASLESTGPSPILIGGFGGTGSLFSEGVAFHRGTTIDAGSGSIVIAGVGGSTGKMNRGVIGSASDLESSGGNILITGTGGGTMMFGVGVDLSSVDLSTTGAGTISIQGTGANGTLGNMGVRLAGNPVLGGSATTENGTITIEGTGGASLSGTVNNHGVQMLGGFDVSSTTGGVTVTGESGAGTTLNHGVTLASGASIEVGTGGPITVRGTSKGTVSLNKGVDLSGSIIEATTSGDITIEGTGGLSATGVFNSGIFVSGGYLGTASGGLTMNGVGGTGTSLNDGIRIANAALEAGGGTIALVGQAHPNTTGVFNTGVTLISTSLVSGNATITGTGGGNTAGNLNHGIYLLRSPHFTTATMSGAKGFGSLSKNVLEI